MDLYYRKSEELHLIKQKVAKGRLCWYIGKAEYKLSMRNIKLTIEYDGKEFNRLAKTA